MTRKLFILLLIQLLVVLPGINAFAYTGESDLGDTIKALKTLTGQSSTEPVATDGDIDDDSKIGLGEAIYWMQDAAGIPLVVSIENDTLKSRLAEALGLGADYTGILTTLDLNSLTGELDLSGSGLTDGDMDLMQHFTGVSVIDLSGNTALTAASANGAIFDWTSLTSLDFSGCTGITGITANAFEGVTALTSMVLPETVTSLGDSSFAGTGLVSITLPGSITTLGNAVFKDCTALTQADISQVPVAALGDAEYLFQGCTAIDDTADIVFPEGFSALTIGFFKDCSGLTAINLPESVTSLGFYAFENCTGLVSVDLTGLTEFGSAVFSGCTHLSQVVFPEGITRLTSHMFANTGFVSIDLPDTLKEIEMWAFLNCTRLKSIVIPNSVTTMGMGVFRDCASLESVKLSENLAALGNHTFMRSGLTYLVLPASVTSLGMTWLDNCNALAILDLSATEFDEANRAWGAIPSDTLVLVAGTDAGLSAAELDLAVDGVATLTHTIPGDLSVTWKSSNAAVATVSDAGVVTGISSGRVMIAIKSDDDAYHGTCMVTVINEAVDEGETSLTLTNDAFTRRLGQAAGKGDDYSGPLTYEELAAITGTLDLSGLGLTNADMAVMKYLTGVSAIDLSGNTALTTIRGATFDWTTLTSLDFSGCTGITGIATNAFEGITSLTALVLPETVTSLGASSFAGCTALTAMEIPAGVTEIGDNCFEGAGLQSITLPAGITSLGTEVCKDCLSLTQADLSGISAEALAQAEGFFSGCTAIAQLADILLPKGGTALPEAFFEDCTGITAIELPGTITSLGDSAFKGCTGITEADLRGITEFGRGVLSGCTGLTRVVLAEGVTSLDGMFNGCSALTSVVLPESLTSLGSNCFTGSGITHLVLPAGVTSIGMFCFQNCSDLAILDLSATSLNSMSLMMAMVPSTTTKLFAVEDAGLSATKLDLEVGESITLTHAVPDGTTVTWLNSNTAVASVSDAGLVAAVGEGSALIAVQSDDGSYNGTCLVNVMEKAVVEGDTTLSLANDAFTRRLGQAVGKGDNYSGSLTYDELAAITGVLDLSGLGLMDADMAVMKYLTGVSVIDLSDNPALTAASARQGVFDWTTLISLDFSGCTGITGIADNAFEGVSNLVGIVLPETVTSLGESSFAQCTALKAIQIPAGVTEIGDSCFRGTAIRSITLPAGLTAISASCFRDSAITHLIVPSGVTSVGSGAFSNCDALAILDISGTSLNPFSLIRAGVPRNTTNLFGATDAGLSPTNLDLTVGEAAMLTHAIPGGTSVIWVNSNTDVAVFDAGLVTGISEGTALIAIRSDDGSYNGTCLVTVTDAVHEGPVSLTLENDALTQKLGLAAGKGEGYSGALTYDELAAIIGRLDLSDLGITDADMAVMKYLTGVYTIKLAENTAITAATARGAIFDWTNLTRLDFAGCTGITRIAGSAFEGVTAPASIVIPNGVTEIGERCFADTGFTAIDLPDTITSFGDEVFSGAGALTTVGLPESLTAIGAGFFSNSGINYLIVPAGITSIDASAFTDCNALAILDLSRTSIETVEAPPTTTVLYAAESAGLSDTELAMALEGDTATLTHAIPDGTPVTWLSSNTDIATVSDTGVVTGMSQGAALIAIQSDDESYNGTCRVTVGGMVTEGDTALTLANDDFTRQLGRAAGKGDDYGGALTYDELAGITGTLDLSGLNLTDGEMAVMKYLVGVSAIDLSGNTALTPASATGEVFVWTSLTTLDFSGCTGITEIADNAFEGITTLTSIVLPETITRLGHGSFFGCTALAVIQIPDGVTEIGNRCFRKTGLQSITLPAGITTLGYEICMNCTALTHADFTGINVSVLTDASRFFQGCTAITDMANILFPEGLTALPRGFFTGCTGITAIDLPDTVTSLGVAVFADCTGITSVDLTGITEIGSSLFTGCTRLSQVVLPEGMTIVSSNMFQYTSLVSIDLPTGITEIGMSAFANCTGLKSFVIPDSVTTLGNGVFWHCSNLETVKLSLNITELPRYAFADTGLHHFVVPERITAIGGICFRECNNLAILDLRATNFTSSDTPFWEVPSTTTVLFAASDAGLSATALNLAVDETTTLTADDIPAGTTVTWLSSDTAVATVSDTGEIIAVGEGTALIAVVSDNETYNGTCMVTVTAGQ